MRSVNEKNINRRKLTRVYSWQGCIVMKKIYFITVYVLGEFLLKWSINIFANNYTTAFTPLLLSNGALLKTKQKIWRIKAKYFEKKIPLVLRSGKI